jgi:hypothetical protein
MHVPVLIESSSRRLHRPCQTLKAPRRPSYRLLPASDRVRPERLCMDSISRLSHICRTSLVPEAYPQGKEHTAAIHGYSSSLYRPYNSQCLAGLRLEVEPNEGVKEVTYDEQEKVVRIPLSAMEGGRRTKLVMFTCNKCGKHWAASRPCTASLPPSTCAA